MSKTNNDEEFCGNMTNENDIKITLMRINGNISDIQNKMNEITYDMTYGYDITPDPHRVLSDLDDEKTTLENLKKSCEERLKKIK